MCFAPQRPALFWHVNSQKCSVFNTFDFEMCFAPQRRALFRHLNFQKWSERGVLFTFWLGNVLRATTACTFFDISTCKSGPMLVCSAHFDLEMCFAPRHMQFFISHLAGWLRTRRFSEATFWSSRATNHWENTVFRDFPTSSRAWILCSFFWLSLLWSFSSSLFSSLLFSCLLFSYSYSSHLCLSSVHIVGSLTSKFSSIMLKHTCN